MAAPTIEEVFALACFAFEQCQLAVKACSLADFMRWRPIHQAYGELHAHMAAGGRIS